jgi:hypothetical protein
LREAATGWFIAGGYTHFLVHRTLSIEAAITVEAVTTRYVMENNDAITDSIFCDPIANRRNDAGSFVAVNAGGRKKVIFDLLEIGMANTAALDFNQDFARGKERSFDGFDGQAAGTAIDSSSHEARYRIIPREQSLISA